MAEKLTFEEILANPENAVCTCPQTACKWHGNCKDCTTLHRYLKSLPNCFSPELLKKS